MSHSVVGVAADVRFDRTIAAGSERESQGRGNNFHALGGGNQDKVHRRR